MNKPNLQTTSNGNLEFQVIEDLDPAATRNMFSSLTAFNEQTVGVKCKTRFIGAYDKGCAIGGIALRWYGADAYIDYLAVNSEWRGKGVGQRLMQLAEEELKQAGCRQAIVSTVAFQAPDFYRRLGYDLVSTVPNYMNGYEQLTFRKVLAEKVIA